MPHTPLLPRYQNTPVAKEVTEQTDLLFVVAPRGNVPPLCQTSLGARPKALGGRFLCGCQVCAMVYGIVLRQMQVTLPWKVKRPDGSPRTILTSRWVAHVDRVPEPTSSASTRPGQAGPPER